MFFCLKQQTNTFFTALHGMQTRYSDENSVRPSVPPTVKRVIYDKMEERSIQIFISYERSFSLFLEEEWLVGRHHFYLKFWFARSSSAATPSDAKKVQLTLIGCPLRASNELKMIVVRCPKVLQRGSHKSKTADFRLKSHFA